MANRLPLFGKFRIQHDLRGTAKKHHQPQKLLARLELSNMFRCSKRPDKTKVMQGAGQGIRIGSLPQWIICMQKQRRHQVFL
jgi:hypothetical protein